MTPPKFFKSETELRNWFLKNHKNGEKQKEIWVGLYKPHAAASSALSQKQAVDQALCFGWTYSILKRIDDDSYKVRFLKRKAKSTWSHPTIQRALALKKAGKMHKAGLEAMNARDKTKSEETPAKLAPWQTEMFKANKAAWDFFNSQTPSYRRYTTMWVVGAKQKETQIKRLTELIKDSAEGTKLKRILAAIEKVKPVYKPGETPIEQGKNLGRVSGVELRSVGIETLEKLKSMGWERAFNKWTDMYPERMNLNALKAIVTAAEDQSWTDMDPEIKAQARDFMAELKRSV